MPIKILRITTVPLAFVHIEKQIQYYIEEGHEVTLLTSFDIEKKIWFEGLGANVKYIDFSRKIHLIKDIFCLFRVWFYLLTHRYDIVHSSTPKAGLICAIAAYFSFTKVRLHTFTGQRWANFCGSKRTFFITLDKIITRLNTHCYTDSESQGQYLTDHGVGNAQSITTLGQGSYGGIYLKRFNQPISKRKFNSLGIEEDSYVFSYVGRVTKDKGIVELVSAFLKLKDKGVKTDLVIIGPLEQELDPIPYDTLDCIHNNTNIHYVGFQTFPESFVAFSNCFCLPSYREGFGTVIIEAAVMGIPAIGTRIPGLIDAIVDKETGLLVEKYNVDELFLAMHEFSTNPTLSKDYGEKARERAIREFDYRKIADLQLKSYHTFL